MITAFLAYKGQFEQRIMALIEQWIQFRLLDVHLERVADTALTDQEKDLALPAAYACWYRPVGTSTMKTSTAR